MAIRPQLVSRGEQPYASITNSVPMPRLSDELQPQIGEVFGWLAARGIQPAGPPFWKYNRIDNRGIVEVEVGVPTADEVSGDNRVQPHLLPGGSYAVARHVGHPQKLPDATSELLDWAASEGIAWDMYQEDEGELWVARLEEYLHNPMSQPDMEKWQTNLIFKLADER
jgi:effector-binding domain-containing protein